MDTVKAAERVFRVDSEFRSLERFHRAVELVRNGYLGTLKTIRVSSPKEEFPQEPAIEAPAPAELDYDMWLGPGAEGALHAEARAQPARPEGPARLVPQHDVRRRHAHQLGRASGRHLPVGQRHRAHRPDRGAGHRQVSTTTRSGTCSRRSTRGTGSPTASRCSTRWTSRRSASRATRAGCRSTTRSRRRIRSSSRRAAPAILSATIPDDGVRFPLRSERVDFIDAVKSRGQTMEDAEVGQRTISICHLAHIGVKRNGKALKWDPVKRALPQ